MRTRHGAWVSIFRQGATPQATGRPSIAGWAESIGMRRGGRAESRRARHFSMIRSFHLADVFTLANGACGTAAIFLAMDHVREARVDKVYAAGLLVVAALVFDVLDGRIARWRHKASLWAANWTHWPTSSASAWPRRAWPTRWA